MKPWQHGIPIAKLKEIELYYKEYNSFALSPFAQYKKNDIARDLHDNSLCVERNESGNIVLAYTKHEAKVRTPITMYQDVVIGYKEKGDKIYSHIIGEEKYIEGFILDIEGPAWIGVWAEDVTLTQMLHDMCRFVGTKITTFGEMYHIYFKDVDNPIFGDRVFPTIDPVEIISTKRMFEWWYESTTGYNQTLQFEIDKIHEELEKAEPKFQNHYSNYNKNKSWSAISLFGYSKDSSFIGKPIEMNKKWKEKNPGWENWELQLTDIADKFPYTLKFASAFERVDYGKIHRVRFMKLSPNEGELERHTDQVDPDSGLTIGKLARLHFPIVTNDQVKFHVWDVIGHEIIFNPEVGEAFVLDTRKPHRVVNGGTTDRIHLVIDIEVSEKLYREFIAKR